MQDYSSSHGEEVFIPAQSHACMLLTKLSSVTWSEDRYGANICCNDKYTYFSTQVEVHPSPFLAAFYIQPSSGRPPVRMGPYSPWGGASGGAGGSSGAGASGGAGASRAWASRAGASSGAGGAGGSGGAEASGAVAELEPAEQGPAVAQVGAAELGPELGQAGLEQGPGPVSESREGPPHPSQQQTDSQLLLP